MERKTNEMKSDRAILDAQRSGRNSKCPNIARGTLDHVTCAGISRVERRTVIWLQTKKKSLQRLHYLSFSLTNSDGDGNHCDIKSTILIRYERSAGGKIKVFITRMETQYK